MKVSIVTISYNQAQFLERALTSVLDQDYEDVEYIVVDPGSTDGSRDIIERYRHKLARVILEPDDGPADGLNKGFAVATGDVFGYLNADDSYAPGTIREAVQAFRDHPKSDVVYGHGYIIDADGKLVRRVRSDGFHLRRYAYGAVMVLQQATFFRRSAFLEVGGFNRTNHTCWDGELLVDMARVRKAFTCVDAYWGLFRIHEASISSSGLLTNIYREDTARIRARVVGNTSHLQYVLVTRFSRLCKWLLNPKTVYFRILEKVAGRPKSISR